MDGFFPFVYKREKKKEWEPEPLYVELIPPPPMEEKKDKEDKEEKDDIDRGVTIIQL